MCDTVNNLDSAVYTLEYFLQEDVCRLCWKRGAKIHIYHKSENNCGENTNNTLSDTIRDCLHLDLSTRTVPDKLCNMCLETIENFSNYKQFCHETDKKLLKIFRNYNFNPQLAINTETIRVKTEIKDEKHARTNPDSLDDFLNSLRPSDHSSDDEKPLKCLKKPKPTGTKTKITNKHLYCYICKTEFETADILTKHKAGAHGVENGLYKCFGCEKTCNTRRGRNGHETQFCKNLRNGYKCPECGTFLPSRGSYEKHMKCHRENGTGTLLAVAAKCRKCPLKFRSKEDLVTHVKEAHCSGKKKFVCESCGREFNRIDYLHKHKLTHTGTKQHVCAHCGFRTTQRTSLTVHIRKHTGERPYSCDLCPQRCVSSSNLRAHRRRHLGDKRFECTLCSKKFGYKVSLDEHIASTHHQSTAHTCTICGSTYTRVRGLKRHILTKHSGKNDDTADGNDAERNDAAGNDVNLAEALKGDEVYVKLQNETYVKVLQVKEAKGVVGFEVKGFDGKMACVGENGEVYDVKIT